MGQENTMIERLIQHLTIGPDDGLQIGYLTPEQDVKASGVMLLHTLIIPPGDQYDDEIEAVLAAIKHLVADVLEDFPDLPALEE